MITHRHRQNSSGSCSNNYANGGASDLPRKIFLLCMWSYLLSFRHRAQSGTKLHFQLSIDSRGSVCVRSTYFFVLSADFSSLVILQCMLITGLSVVACCFQVSAQIESTTRLTEGIILFAQEIADQLIYDFISTLSTNANIIRTNQKIP